MKYVATCFLGLISQFVIAQGVAAFSDYQKRFWVFDGGKSRQLEYQPILSYAVGNKSVGYVTNSDHLKVYYNHIDYELGSMVSSYAVTDHLVTYKINSQLFVFEEGHKQMLSKYVGQYLAGDSLVAFFDTEKRYFQVYYHGQVITLADGLLSDDAGLFQVGSNMVCFRDLYQNFWLFYRGNMVELLRTNEEITSKIGRDVLAFIDPATDYLQVFYQGEVSTIESFRPESFQVGYDKVAYVTNTGDFKLFDHGQVFDVSSFAPDVYELKGDILVYQQQGQLFAFYGGENYLIENYIPSNYKLNYNALAYLDQNGYLRLFKAGERFELSFEKINEFQVLTEAVIFNEGMNTTKVFFDGKTYAQ